MRIAIALFGALAVWSAIIPGQSGPFSPTAAVSLDVQPAVPVVGSDFTVSVHVNLEGVTGRSSDPAALGGFVIPVAFDNSRVTLKAVAGGSASNFASGFTYTDVRKANTRGYVTLVNAQNGAGGPTGKVHIATLTFAADQGGTVQFNTNSARARWEGSLSSTYDPGSSEGPALIAYTDAITSVDIQQRDAPYRLICPSLVSTSSDFQGVAIVNGSLTAATLTFRAFGAGGALLAGTGMSNPNTHAGLFPHAQYVKVVEEIFALRDVLDTDRGWIEVESTSPNTSGFFLVNGTLVDGTGAAPILDAVLAIGDRGRIVGVGRRGQVEIPPGTDVIDVQGATILPGFINAHVHDAYSAANLKAWASAGVTTVRDEGINRSGVRLKDLILQRDAAWNLPLYSRLVSAGWMITAPGGYGRAGVSTPEEASRFVAEELDAGADLIKVAVEDGIAGRTDMPVLSAAALQAALAAAHARGKAVSAHITDARFFQTVVDAGVDDAAHAAWDPVPDAVFRQMIARDITMVPTLTVFEAYGALAGAQANLSRFVALGGNVALGNDYTDVPQNNFPHFELGMPTHEIRRMAESGMTAMQIIVAATKNAARVCGLDGELGTLETGKAADVLVVNGDPLRDLGALTEVRLVIHRGTVIRGR